MNVKRKFADNKRGKHSGDAERKREVRKRMKVALIDVDGHHFPNIPLMKISAHHKAKGDSVEWYDPMFTGHCDRVYMSKVFSFSPDYEYFIDADEIIKGGSGYCISLDETGREVYDATKENRLSPEIEHIYPDYSLYPDETKNTAYGFLTRGCPRQCSFCHTSTKDGTISHKVCNLSEFWQDQKNIVLLDQNILACKNWRDLLQQLIDSKANIEFNGGLDIRLMTEEKAKYVSQIKQKIVHFAWDRYEDKDKILPKFEMFKRISGFSERKMIVYTIVNYDTTLEQDLERIYTLKKLGYWAYVMIYNKEKLPRGHTYKKLQRWCNNRFIFGSGVSFEDYLKGRGDRCQNIETKKPLYTG